MILRVKKLSITNFVTNCKSKANSILTFKKKKGRGNFEMELRWIHNHNFEVKSICTKLKKPISVNWNQNDACTSHKQHSSKTHHDLDLGGGHHFAPYNILCDCLVGVHQCGKKT